MSELTTESARQLLFEQSKALVAEMVATNKPLERELERINQHLARLNGQVAKHAEALSDGRGVIAGLKKDLERIDRAEGEERRVSMRREDDVEQRVALIVKERLHAAETGENKRITMRDFYITVGTCIVLWAILKALKVIP